MIHTATSTFPASSADSKVCAASCVFPIPPSPESTCVTTVVDPWALIAALSRLCTPGRAWKAETNVGGSPTTTTPGDDGRTGVLARRTHRTTRLVIPLAAAATVLVIGLVLALVTREWPS